MQTHAPSFDSVPTTLNSPVADKPTSNSKLWAVAIAVGVLVLGAGVFGAIGLFHTHGLLCLPHWLSSAIGTIGAIPYNIGLWALAGGGFAVGSGLIVTGIIKLVRTHSSSPAQLGELLGQGKVNNSDHAHETLGHILNFGALEIEGPFDTSLVPENEYQIFGLNNDPDKVLIAVNINGMCGFSLLERTAVTTETLKLENLEQPALGNLVKEGDVKQAEGALVSNREQVEQLGNLYGTFDLELSGFSLEFDSVQVTQPLDGFSDSMRKYYVYELTGAPLERLIVAQVKGEPPERRMVPIKEEVNQEFWFCRCPATKVAAKTAVLESIRFPLP